MPRYYYLLWNPGLRKIIECEVISSVVIVDFGTYSLIYSAGTDRLIVRLPLGRLTGMYDVADLDIEAGPSTHLLDALEQLLRESIVLYEEVEE